MQLCNSLYALRNALQMCTVQCSTLLCTVVHSSCAVLTKPHSLASRSPSTSTNFVKSLPHHYHHDHPHSHHDQVQRAAVHDRSSAEQASHSLPGCWQRRGGGMLIMMMIAITDYMMITTMIIAMIISDVGREKVEPCLL